MPWQPAGRLVAEQLPFPVRVVGQAPPAARSPAPAAGEHSEQILAEVLGYDAERIAALRAAGALGRPPSD
jgi:crotonobetainyl-CoA:carnitine CoA-transferase CaiB-like acyl-CoA transferase